MRADLELLDELSAFCLQRARERAVAAWGGGEEERARSREAVQSLRALRRDYLEQPWAAFDGLDFFLTYAMRDRHHPDYRAEWTAFQPC